MKEIAKVAKSIFYATKGLMHAYRTDESFRLEVVFGLPIYFLLAWFLFPFQTWEALVFIFSYLLILIVELINTAFETMLDKLHPQEHEAIGRSKDIASGAVLLAFIFAAVVVVVLCVSRIPEDVPAQIVRPFV